MKRQRQKSRLFTQILEYSPNSPSIAKLYKFYIHSITYIRVFLCIFTSVALVVWWSAFLQLISLQAFFPLLSHSSYLSIFLPKWPSKSPNCIFSCLKSFITHFTMDKISISQHGIRGPLTLSYSSVFSVNALLSGPFILVTQNCLQPIWQASPFTLLCFCSLCLECPPVSFWLMHGKPYWMRIDSPWKIKIHCHVLWKASFLTSALYMWHQSAPLTVQYFYLFPFHSNFPKVYAH